jgi:DNA-binding NarL/FixJ family response regulator
VTSSPSRIRVLLAEDHALVRSGLHALLQRMPDVEVVGEAGDGREAVALAEQLHPDVILMDISMPLLNGIEATRRVTAQMPRVRVIMLSVHSSEEYVAQALTAGAAGYVLKGADTAELELGIRAVAAGHSYLTPAVSRQVIDEYVSRVSARAPQSVLTPRQREVLQLIAEGKTSKDVANLLGVSLKTVETHRSQLMRRLGLHDIPALVRYAIREGLISSDV